VIFNLIALSVLIYRQLTISQPDLWFIVPYSLFLIFLATRARALKKRVAELVDVAAHRAGLQRVVKNRRPLPVETPPPPVDAAVEIDVAARG
jgi:hypothetical protein